MKTALCTHPIFLEHHTGYAHPESRERLISTISYLESKSYYKDLVQLIPKPAGENDILKVHSNEHIQDIKSINGKKGYLDGDTPYSEQSSQASFLAAGSGITLVDNILEGKIKNGLALVRPPGHHAERDHAMGFCFFNNVAITARYIQNKGFRKILILDWDVHHGNGTESSFYEDDSVYFISTHQYPFYPGTGKESDTGRGKGIGKTLNLPYPRGAGDYEYLNGFREKIIPAIDNFQPEFILISAGFDGHKRDPLAGIELSTGVYETFSRMILDRAEQICGGRVVSFLEGGYDLSALSESVEVHLSVLHGF